MAKNNCCETNCDYTSTEIIDLIYNLKLEKKEYDLKYLQSIYYGKQIFCENSKSIDFSFYLWALNLLKDKWALNQKVCLCPEEISKLYSNAASLLSEIKNTRKSDKQDGDIDVSNEITWIKNNPSCSSREQWERLSHIICEFLEVKVTTTEIKCDFTFDVVRQEINCDILTGLSLAEKACELNVKPKRTEAECKAEWKVFIESFPNGPDFKTYKAALKTHNLTYETVKAIYAAGLTLGLNKIGTCTLNTALKSYDLSDISFSKLLTSDNIQNGLISTSIQTDLKKFLTDYNSTTLTNSCLQ